MCWCVYPHVLTHHVQPGRRLLVTGCSGGLGAAACPGSGPCLRSAALPLHWVPRSVRCCRGGSWGCNGAMGLRQGGPVAG